MNPARGQITVVEQLEQIGGADFLISLAILLVVYKALSISGQFWLNKKAPAPASLACQTDPMHFQRIKDIHRATMDTEEKKQHGDFACQFKDRDEVRDLIEMIRQSVQATRDLTNELKLTRNGNSARRE